LETIVWIFLFVCEARGTGKPHKPNISCLMFQSVNSTDFEKCTYVKVKRKAKQKVYFFASDIVFFNYLKK